MSDVQPGHNSNAQLKAIVDRIEHVEDEISLKREDVKEIYVEAKSGGYDVKALRTVIRMRKLHPEERQQREAILETYLHALGML